MKIDYSFFPTYKYPNNNLKNYTGFNTLSFKGVDLMSLPEADVLEKVRNSVLPENFLGAGTEAEVYRIKDTNYCVRIPYLSQDIYLSDFTKKL